MRRWPLVCALLIAASGLASAEEPATEAARYFAAGNQAYEDGQYLLAANAYEEAYRLTPLPAIGFTMAQSYRRHYYADPNPHWLLRAKALYQQYLAEVPKGGRRAHAVTHLASIDDLLIHTPGQTPEPPPPPVTQLMVLGSAPGARGRIDDGAPVELPYVEEVTPGSHRVRVEAPGHLAAEESWLAVEGRLVVAELEPIPRPARLHLHTPAGASVSIDGRAHGGGDPIELPAGSHTVAVTARGHRPFVRRIELGFGQELSIDARLSRTRQRSAAYWVLAGSGALLVSGGVTTLLSLSAQSDAHDIEARLIDLGGTQPTWSDADRREFNAAISERDGLRKASAVLFSGALALGVTGALLYFLDSPRAVAPREGGPTLRPVVGPEMIGAAFSARYR